MNRDHLLNLYDHLTKLVEKLPGGLQKPILRELLPIREVFLEQRPARLLLLGGPGKSVPEILHALGAAAVETGDADQGWRCYRVPDRAEVLILDARLDTPQAIVENGLGHFSPDAILFLKEPGDNEASFTTGENRLAACPRETPLIGMAFGGDSERARLAALLSSRRDLSARLRTVCEAQAGETLAEALCDALPNPAKLDFARLSGARAAQAQIAGSLLKSFTAVCGVIGLQPIPLADMPVLTTLQTFMVGLIIHTTGRPVTLRLITEFLGALGLNIGAGILFRESARAIIKIIPFWGNAVSGLVAGAGTYAIGRAAIAYFIEEVPITETRKLFQKLLPSWDAFKRRRLPSLLSRKHRPPES